MDIDIYREEKNMDGNRFNQLISGLANWIDVEVLAQALVEELEDAYDRCEVEHDITLPALKKFYLSLLGNINEDARYFVGSYRHDIDDGKFDRDTPDLYKFF